MFSLKYSADLKYPVKMKKKWKDQTSSLTQTSQNDPFWG